MPYADLERVRLWYEMTGPESGDPLVLVHGLGAQMIAWPSGLISLLEDAGFRVLRLDNRDVGLSQSFGDAAGYTVHDMARDVIDLAQHVGFAAVHLVGQSMGGMIAQQVAIDAPDSVLSLASIYSAPGPGYFIADDEAVAVRSHVPAPDRESRIAHYIAQERISGLDDLTDIEIRELAVRIVDRAWTPEGQARQAAAISVAPDRTSQLAQLTIPVAVIHGREDRLISFEGGIATARAIPGAELHVYAEMGHQLRQRYWADFVGVIHRTRQRALGGSVTDRL